MEIKCAARPQSSDKHPPDILFYKNVNMYMYIIYIQIYMTCFSIVAEAKNHVPRFSVAEGGCCKIGKRDCFGGGFRCFSM